ncbi:hypothetical protein, partial [Bacillus safensis]|uniref:hypothetical protein n=1 Tax=Bacillus safensis TaxID=561879 RepID=UPI002E1B681E|nr:hypothetical protein [Bacillus safensis]
SEPSPLEDFFDDFHSISNHMLRKKDNSFTIIAEVHPVNYFLKSASDQETIDVAFETWLATLNYPDVQIFIQSRLIDLTDPIEEMKKNMEQADDLNAAAISYGHGHIQDLINWQYATPRYETRFYLAFTYRVKPGTIIAENEEEYEEKLIDKSFAELFRRVNSAKSHLRRAEVSVELLSTDGILDLYYHIFNRQKALKSRFSDLSMNENRALYVTADQSDSRIELVKENINDLESKANAV